MTRLFAGLIVLLGCALAMPAGAQTGLTIDIPVVLKQAKVVFNMDHPAFEGDHPTGINFMQLMTTRFAEDKTEATIIAVFHGEIGYMLLADTAYNKVRGTSTGNPYKAMIAALQARGVRMEECGQTAHVHGWVNADFLPGVKINAAANLRIVELTT